MRRWITIAAFGALASAPGPAAAITIDEFVDPPGGQLVSILNGALGDTDSDTATGLAAVGGSRLLDLQILTSVPGASEARAEVNGPASAGSYQLSHTAAAGSFAQIVYDANGAGLNFDMTGNALLQLEGVVIDHTTVFNFFIETFGGSAANCEREVSPNFSGIPGTTPGFVDFVSCNFNGRFNGVAANDIDRIIISIRAIDIFDRDFPGGDVLIDRLVAVPEPATVLLLGLGTTSLAWLRRRPQ